MWIFFLSNLSMGAGGTPALTTFHYPDPAQAQWSLA